MQTTKARSKPISKKRKFVRDGIFYAELNDFLSRELAQDGYAGCEVRVTPNKTEIIIRATRTQNVVGEKARRIKELTALIQKRFKFAPNEVELFAEKVKNKALSALAQAEAVRFRLFEGLSVRRAGHSVLKFIMDNNAKGCEVVVSGKLRGQRAKSMKFKDGYMISAGDAVNYYIDSAVKHIKLRQGVLGIKVKIMLPYDPENKEGGALKKLPDIIEIKEPKQRQLQPIPVVVANDESIHPRLYEHDQGHVGDNSRLPDAPSHLPDSPSHPPDAPSHPPDAPSHPPDAPSHLLDAPSHPPDAPPNDQLYQNFSTPQEPYPQDR